MLITVVGDSEIDNAVVHLGHAGEQLLVVRELRTCQS